MVWDWLTETPLHRAAFRGSASEVKTLLDQGANIHAEAAIQRRTEGRTNVYEGVTPLHIAGMNPDAAVAGLLLDRGARIEARTPIGVTPLRWAVAFGSYAAVELLLDRGADVEAAVSGSTALHNAVARETPERTAMAELLLDRGADIEATDSGGLTPCQRAQERGLFTGSSLMDRLCAASSLAPSGPDVRWVVETPLHRAAYEGSPSEVAALLDQGMDIHSTAIIRFMGHQFEGMTPLHIAVLNPDLAVAELLLDRGANINLPTPDGWTPTYFAVEARQGEMLEFLESKGGLLRVFVAVNPTATATPPAAPSASSFSWAQDGLTEIERQALGHLLTIESQQPIIAKIVLRFTWVSDSITDDERLALSYFEIIGGVLQSNFGNNDGIVQDIQARLEVTWLSDGINGAELNLLAQVSTIQEPSTLLAVIFTLQPP